MKLALMIDVPGVAPEKGYVRVPNGTFEETLSLAAELGFEAVELMIDRPENLDLDGLLAAQRKTGLKVAAVNSGRLYFNYGLGLIAEKPAVSLAGRQSLLELARLTAPLDAPINIGVFRGLPGKRPLKDALEALVAMLRETADEISALGVTLVLEPSNHIEFPFISSTAEGIALIEQVNRPNVCLMLDTFHMAVEEEIFRESFSAAMPLLRHIHLLDRSRNPPAAAETDFDLTGMIELLLANNYQHYISMPMHQNGDNEETAGLVAALKDAIKQIAGQPAA